MSTHNNDCAGLDHSSSQITDLYNEQSLMMIGFSNPSAIRASWIQKYLICNRNNFKIKSSCPFFKWFPVMAISEVTLQPFYNLHINYLNMTCLHLALLKSWPAVYWQHAIIWTNEDLTLLGLWAILSWPISHEVFKISVSKTSMTITLLRLYQTSYWAISWTENNIWVTVNNDVFGHEWDDSTMIHEWRSHEWKSLENFLTSDKKHCYSWQPVYHFISYMLFWH